MKKLTKEYSVICDKDNNENLYCKIQQKNNESKLETTDSKKNLTTSELFLKMDQSVANQHEQWIQHIESVASKEGIKTIVLDIPSVNREELKYFSEEAFSIVDEYEENHVLFYKLKKNL